MAVLAACVGAAGAAFLALNHPLLPLLAIVVAACVAAVAWQAPAVMLAVLVACLPAIGLMPWSGWLVAEELDLLVLAAGAGGYARIAFDRLVQKIRPERSPHQAGATALKALTLGLFIVSTGYSMLRGFDDAGGLAWSWWHGYHEPLNSLRLAKSIVLAAWLLPLMRLAWRRDEAATDHALGLGFVGGLLTVSLIVTWERLANTGLLNFSTDYRTTALFWEMHVGGAALDGFLALVMPFAVREVLVSSSNRRWLLAAVVVMAGAYASLVTFSRGVYLAVPVAVALMWVLLSLQRRRGGWRPEGPAIGRSWIAGLVLWLVFAGAAVQMFLGSGYRGMLALLGAFVLLLPMASVWRGLSLPGWLSGLATAAVLAPFAALVSTLVPKGAYWIYAAAWVGGAGVLTFARLRPAASASAWLGALALALYATVVVMLCMVALHWGESRGLESALPVAALLALLAVAGGLARRPRWSEAPRWQGGLLAAMAASAVATGVFFGGAYMGGRFETVGHDLDKRFEHWELALSWLRDPTEQAFGRGTGRYPGTHFVYGPVEERIGDYRWRADGAQGGHVALTAGRHVQGWGEMFRLSQRIGPSTGPVTVRLDVRAAADTTLHFEICRKSLLYDDGCMAKAVGVKATGGQWRALEVELSGKGIDRGASIAPHLIAFSMAVAGRGTVMEVDNVRLNDSIGRQLVANGDFGQGMARWYFTSDRNHMPWHMKNMPLHVLFEQGWVGLLLWSTLLAGALWRTTLGRARDHPLAPALAGGIAGFFVVGMFDSLLDAPRVAWLFYLAVLLALALPARAGPAGR